VLVKEGEEEEKEEIMREGEQKRICRRMRQNMPGALIINRISSLSVSLETELRGDERIQQPCWL